MGHADTHETVHGKFNDRDFDGIREQLADDVTFVDIGAGEEHSGPDAAMTWIQNWATGFSDARIADASYMDGPDHSVALFNAQGTHDGEFAEIPATGKTMSVPFCEVVTYTDDGKVATNRVYYNAADVMQQLGLMPDAAPA